MSIKLYYLHLYGRGEPIRMLLNHAKVPFEEINFQLQEMQEVLKQQDIYEFKQCPVLEIDGKRYAQTIAILQLLGKLHGYYPEDPFTAYRVESSIQALSDIYQKLWEVIMESDEAKKAQLRETFLKEQLPFYFEVMSKRLNENES